MSMTVESALRHLADMCAAALGDKELCQRAMDRATSILNNNRIEYVKDTQVGRVTFVTVWRYKFDSLDVSVDMDMGEVMLVFKKFAMPALVLRVSRQRESAVSVSSELIGMYNIYDEILLNTIKNIIKGRQ